MSELSTRKRMAVGVFIAVGLVILLGTVFTIGGQHKTFLPQNSTFLRNPP